MGLTKVWVRTFTDGLVRADHVIGLSTHPTPSLAGKPAHWLVDATLAVSIGSGNQDEWTVDALHRTLLQTRAEPVGAIEAFARLLAKLAESDPAGIIDARTPAFEETPTGRVEFSFTPFDENEPFSS
jgi:hypothetical protein